MSAAQPQERFLTPEEVTSGIRPPVREAMLDLILSWGALDHSVSELYCLTLGIDEVEHASEVGSKPVHLKLREMQMHVQPDHAGLARSFGKLKKRYEEHSKLRDLVAHGRCVGRLKSEDETAVFLRFRAFGPGLTAQVVSVDALRLSATFGLQMLTATLNTVRDYRIALGQATPDEVPPYQEFRPPYSIPSGSIPRR